MIARFTITLLGISTTLWTAPQGRNLSVDPQGAARGDVLVLTSYADGGREADIVALIDEARDGQSPDGEVDQVFVLQGQASAVRAVQYQLRDVDIVWTARTVVMNWSGGGKLSLVGPNTDVRPEGGEVIDGFGLSHSAQWRISVPRRALTAVDYQRLLKRIRGSLDACGQYECRAFGASCSYSCGGQSCEVSCAGGQNACCGCGEDGSRAVSA